MWSNIECLSIGALCGGVKNIEKIYSCFTRVHVVLKDIEVITENKKARLLKLSHVKAVFVRRSEVQLVVGVESDRLAESLKKELVK